MVINLFERHFMYREEDDDEIPEGDFYQCNDCGLDYQFVELDSGEEWKHETILENIFCCNDICKSKKLTPMNLTIDHDCDNPWVRYAGGQEEGF